MSTSPPAAAAPSTGTLGKVRSPLGVLVLMIVTLGIYAFVYYFKTFKELKEYSGEGLGGGVGLLLTLFCGFLTVFLLPAEVGNLYGREGREKPVSGITGLWNLVPLIGGLIWLWKTQGALNDFWESKGASS